MHKKLIKVTTNKKVKANLLKNLIICNYLKNIKH